MKKSQGRKGHVHFAKMGRVTSILALCGLCFVTACSGEDEEVDASATEVAPSLTIAEQWRHIYAHIKAEGLPEEAKGTVIVSLDFSEDLKVRSSKGSRSQAIYLRSVQQQHPEIQFVIVDISDLEDEARQAILGSWGLNETPVLSIPELEQADLITLPAPALAIFDINETFKKRWKGFAPAQSVTDTLQGLPTVKKKKKVKKDEVHGDSHSEHEEEAHGEEAHGEEAHGEEAHGEEAAVEEAAVEEAHGEEAHGEEAHGEEAHGEEAAVEEAAVEEAAVEEAAVEEAHDAVDNHGHGEDEGKDHSGAEAHGKSAEHGEVSDPGEGTSHEKQTEQHHGEGQDASEYGDELMKQVVGSEVLSHGEHEGETQAETEAAEVEQVEAEHSEVEQVEAEHNEGEQVEAEHSEVEHAVDSGQGTHSPEAEASKKKVDRYGFAIQDNIPGAEVDASHTEEQHGALEKKLSGSTALEGEKTPDTGKSIDNHEKHEPEHTAEEEGNDGHH